VRLVEDVTVGDPVSWALVVRMLMAAMLMAAAAGADCRWPRSGAAAASGV